MRWFAAVGLCAACSAIQAPAPPERRIEPPEVERGGAIRARLRFVIQEREPPEQTPRLSAIAPTAGGEVWLGGTKNLRGLLTAGGFSPRPWGVTRDCSVETDTRSILVRSDGSVDLVGLQRCAEPESAGSEATVLEHVEGETLRPWQTPSSSKRLSIALHEPAPGHLYATASDPHDYIAGEGTGGSLYEWTASGWQLRLALPGENIHWPVVDGASRLWVTAIEHGPNEASTRVLRWERSTWVSEPAPGWGYALVAADGSLFFQGLTQLWLRDGERWIPRPAPKARALVVTVPRTKNDVYFLVFPPRLLHYDGSGFTPIPIEGVVWGRMDGNAPVNLTSHGEHLWLKSTDRVWKLAPEDAPQPAPVTF